MPDTVNLDTLLRLLGRLHPMVVHFPIGLLVAATVVEYARAIVRGGLGRAPRSAMGPACLALGALGAVVAVWFGWLNADLEGQNPEKVFWHRWLGVGVAAVACLTWLVSLLDRAEEGGAPRLVYRAGLGVCSVGLAIGGHLGASLTYGDDYLQAVFRAPVPVDEPGAVATDVPEGDRVDFAAHVRPILEAHCYECHGPEKRKGGLRLDDMNDVFAGPRDGWVIRPGDPEGSDLLFLITLPADDPDVMPAKGDPLVPEQIDVIRRWIAEGAAWKASAATPVRPSADVPPSPPPAPAAPAARADPFVDRPVDAAAVAAALASLEEIGAVAGPVARDTRAHEVNLSLARQEVDDAALARLAGLEPVLIRLDLSGTAVTDEGMAALAAFTNLRALRLDRTAVGDRGLARLTSLERLEVLNLHSTQVTDAGLDSLAALPALERLYLWQSAVTEAGVDAFGDRHPGILVDDGRLALAPPPAPEPVDVHAVLAERCYGCHGPEKQKAGLRLDLRAEVVGMVVIEGKPEESELLTRVALPPEHEDRMPPMDERLRAEEIAAIRAWIVEGAPWPSGAE